MRIPFSHEQQQKFMAEALRQACKAYRAQEVPVGAIVVHEDGIIAGCGYNKTITAHCQSAHAEIRAITKAGRKNCDWRLEKYWLFVTLEPCTMCMGLIRLSRLAGVIYAADSPLFGYRLDSTLNSRVYKKDAPIIISGILQEQSVQLLQKFFSNKRKTGE